MKRGSFEDLYEAVLATLERRHPYLAAAVQRLGPPQLGREIETAAIVASGEDVRLLVNPDFAAGLSLWELAAVLAHEAFHLAFGHHQRAAAYADEFDRHLFSLACEAVINDLIQAKFPDLKLPGHPVTGSSLLGRDTSQMPAEKVQGILRQKADSDASARARFAVKTTLDDHRVWNSGLGQPLAGGIPVRTRGQREPARELAEWIRKQLGADHACGDAVTPFAGFSVHPHARERVVSPSRSCPKEMVQFLVDTARGQLSYETRWATPNRKLLQAYPDIILPTYEVVEGREVLVAIDASGSVPDSFVAVALSFARQKIPRTTIRVVSFDTAWYEVTEPWTSVRGGGGTRAQAVEEFIETELRSYPDYVFILTDGETPPPKPLHPERWIWLLPAQGSTKAIPAGSRIGFFDPVG